MTMPTRTIGSHSGYDLLCFIPASVSFLAQRIPTDEATGSTRRSRRLRSNFKLAQSSQNFGRRAHEIETAHTRWNCEVRRVPRPVGNRAEKDGAHTTAGRHRLLGNLWHTNRNSKEDIWNAIRSSRDFGRASDQDRSA